MSKILVVDDDPHLLKIMKDWLTVEKHEVSPVATGIEAWDNLEKNTFDLVILDWDLPDINGIDILKRYREAGGTTAVLMLTGRSSVDNKAEGLDTGADDYLTKPFHMKELSARIRAALRKHETSKPKPLGGNNKELLEKADLVGTALASRYEFLDVLGKGGIGVVFKARHPHLDKLVAIKMVQKGAASEEILARFEQEARAISRLDHPNIAVVHDFGVTERHQPFMVMELIEGKSLEDILNEHGKLPLENTLDILLQICSGMAAAHSAGILHRDLKPSNVILKQVAEGPPVIKILDFGCARIRQLDAEKAPKLTQEGSILGTPSYMCPEIVQSGDADERSDIYSLGCIIYELLTGTLPHSGKDAISVMFKHATEDITPIAARCPELNFSPQLNHVVARALARDPAKRYQSMGELKSDLERIKAELQTKEKKTSRWLLPLEELSKNLKERLQGKGSTDQRNSS